MNKLQCPHCLTDYTISNEQLRQSQGIVRCSQCLETFDANTELNKAKQAFDPRSAFIEPLSHCDEDESARIGLDDILPDSRQVEFKDQSMAPVNFNDARASDSINVEDSETHSDVLDLDEILRGKTSKSVSAVEDKVIEEPLRPRPNAQTIKSIQDSIDPNLSVHLDDDDTLLESSVKQSDDNDSYTIASSFEMEASTVEQADRYVTQASVEVLSQSTQTSDIATDYIEEPSIAFEAPTTDTGLTLPKTESKTIPAQSDLTPLEPSIDQPKQQHELDLTEISDDFEEQSSETIMLDDFNHSKTSLGLPKNLADVHADKLPDSQLIDEVDQLIDNKLVKQTPPEVALAEDTLFVPTNKKTTSWLVICFFSPILLIIIATLSSVLIYQLWQKQMISWPDRQDVQLAIAPVSMPVIEKLEQLNIKLPVRRNLSALQLLSAKTEAHPSRSSTILLRISLINRAEIEQPLPWLELSLNNSEGKIISRRSLSPKDYIHNNRISSSIGAKELKKVTIELLSFPKHAAGYELKLLNK